MTGGAPWRLNLDKGRDIGPRKDPSVLWSPYRDDKGQRSTSEPTTPRAAEDRDLFARILTEDAATFGALETPPDEELDEASEWNEIGPRPLYSGVSWPHADPSGPQEVPLVVGSRQVPLVLERRTLGRERRQPSYEMRFDAEDGVRRSNFTCLMT